MKKVALLCVLGVLVFTGCHNVGGGIRLEAGFPHAHHAPPPHALAHGRRHHMYHYYPHAEFYFDVGRNMYFYLDTHGQWSFSVTLPVRLRHHLHSGFVEIEMEETRPYLRHKYHKNKYKNHKYKRKYKKSKRYQDHQQKGYFGDEGKERYKKKEYYKNKEHYKKKDRPKKGGFFGDEEDDDRGKKGRGDDRD